MICIGIDTGKHTGIALWDTDARKFRVIETVPIHVALKNIREMWLWRPLGESIEVYFEDARQRKWIPSERDFRQVKGRAMGAGSVKRDATIWEDALNDWGIPFHAVAPKHNTTKMTPEFFRALTGWKGRTSEHSRDAAMLVFGR